jgi:hypothetical protein
VPDGMEVAPPNEGDEQVVQQEKEAVRRNEEALMGEDRKTPLENIDQPHGTKRVCGMRVKRFFMLLAVVAVLITGLAVGLGVGLFRGDDSPEAFQNAAPSPTLAAQDALSIGGGLNDSYYSTSGA